MRFTPMGGAITAAIDLDFAVNHGITIPLSDLTYMQFRLLRIISEERGRFEEEEMKRRSEEAQLRGQNRPVMQIDQTRPRHRHHGW